MNQKAIVLVSGGMDSLVTVSIAANENHELFFLHMNYGQLTEDRELESFQALIDHYRPKDTLIADLSYLKDIGGSSLVDLNMQISTSGIHNNIPSTYVPFRNAHLLCVAVSWAEVVGATRIYIGVVEEDSSGYPDCREDFIQAFNHLISFGTKPETLIKIITPVIHKSKAEIVKLGNELNAPFHLSWSCYRSNDKACGVCDSCRLRINAFKKTGTQDPIEYAIPINWEINN